jgi:hypothetical protein
MKAFVNDLRYAQTIGVAVEVDLLTGERILTGVHDVNEDEGFVSFYSPQVHGDTTTTRKVALDLLASVTIIGDMQWPT